MVEMLKKVRNTTVISSILTILVGVLFALAPVTSADIIVMIGGWAIIVLGIVNIITYVYTTVQYGIPMSSILSGLVKILIGMFIIIKPEIVETIMAYIFAIYIICDGVKSIEQGVKLVAVKVSGSVFYLILSIAITVAGFVLVFSPFDSLVTMMLYIGIVLIIDGVNALINIITIQNKADEIKDTFTSSYNKFANVIDAEFKPKNNTDNK